LDSEVALASCWVRGLVRPAGGVLGLLQQVHRPGLLVTELQDDRCAVQELLRVRGLQELQGGAEAARHKPLGGDLADRVLPFAQRLLVALRRLAGGRGLGFGLGHLDLERVVLLPRASI